MNPLVTMTKLDFVLLCSNLFVLGAITVLIILTGADVPKVLLVIGSIGMIIAKLGRAMAEAKKAAA